VNKRLPANGSFDRFPHTRRHGVLMGREFFGGLRDFFQQRSNLFDVDFARSLHIVPFDMGEKFLM
jgi:hypothetical protein